MNREAEEFSISSDINQANLEILQVRLEQAEHCIREVAASLAWNCFGECRAVHDGPIMPAQGALEMAREFLTSHQPEGFTHFPELLESVQQMDAILKAEGAQGEREVTPNPSCSMCSGNGYFCEFSTVETCWCCLPEPEPEETVEALKERIESLKAVVTHMKQQRDAAVARAALAQPSPAPELERPEVVAWALQRKRDGFVRATWHQKPSETQYEIAELDGDVIAPLYAAPSVSTWKVPEGFALVPIEPTVAMRMPWKTMRGYSWHSKYKAMLAAAAVQRGEL